MRERLGYVVESDLDLVLVLDAHTNGPMTRFLANRAGLTLGSPVTAARSTLRCAGTRETDVEVSWPGAALLIEDKVDAAFTPGQPESYRVEVNARCVPGKMVVRSILVCPERRRVAYALDAGDSFDVIVTCLELADAAKSSGDRFGEAAAMVMLAAEAPRPMRPTTVVDLLRSEWGDAYRCVLAEVLPHGQLLQPGPGSLRTATAEWMFFRSAGVDPEAVWTFGHWITRGELRMELMVEAEPIGLPPAAVVTRKPQMWWVSLPVPALTFDRPAEEQLEGIEAAVLGALSLRGWAAAAGLRVRPRPANDGTQLSPTPPRPQAPTP